MPGLAPSGLLLPRVFGALLLRTRAYAEVASDVHAGIQSGMIVVIAGILEGTVSAAVHQDPMVESTQILYSVTAALIGWFLWSFLLFTVGARAFGHSSEFPPVLRVIAFAHAPVLIYGLAAVPGLQRWAGALLVLSLLWFAAALVAAARGVFAVTALRAFVIVGLTLASHEVLRQAFRLFGLVG